MSNHVLIFESVPSVGELSSAKQSVALDETLSGWLSFQGTLAFGDLRLRVGFLQRVDCLSLAQEKGETSKGKPKLVFVFQT